MEQSDKLT